MINSKAYDTFSRRIQDTLFIEDYETLAIYFLSYSIFGTRLRVLCVLFLSAVLKLSSWFMPQSAQPLNSMFSLDIQTVKWVFYLWLTFSNSYTESTGVNYTSVVIYFPLIRDIYLHTLHPVMRCNLPLLYQLIVILLLPSALVILAY